jgi:nuclear transport factor 2 (NTF2) superfamily protein
MRSNTLFVALLAIALLLCGARESAAQETKARDLSRYKDGGTYDLKWSRSGAELEEMRSKLRAFLWERWSKRRPGRITATIYTIEGDPTTTTFYVEPDKNGDWRVATEYESVCCWSDGMEGKERKRETGKEFYNVVERIVGGRDDKAKQFQIIWSVIPEGEKRQPHTYTLRLRKTTRNQEGNSKEVAFIL